MKEYQRTTKQVKFDRLPAETIQACQKYFEKHELENVVNEIISCVETRTERIKKSFFGKIFGEQNYAKYVAVFFTSTRLFWCSTDLQNVPTVLSAKLQNIEITDFANQLIEDNGLQILEEIGHNKERSQIFIGFGEEIEAQQFRKLLKETARK